MAFVLLRVALLLPVVLVTVVLLVALVLLRLALLLAVVVVTMVLLMALVLIRVVLMFPSLSQCWCCSCR